MNDGRYGRFGALIGVAYVSSTHCRFLVSSSSSTHTHRHTHVDTHTLTQYSICKQIYSTKNAEVLADHEQKLRQIVHNAGWLEYDPAEIWKLMQECIEVRNGENGYIILRAFI